MRIRSSARGALLTTGAALVAGHLFAGCGGAGGAGGDDGLTWYRDVKPLVDQRCVACHSDGGIAPFSLETYGDAFAVREGIRREVEAGTMPPWPAADGCAEYANDRSLSDEQIALITQWVDEGAPEGDPADEPEPLPALSSRLERRDVTLAYDEPYTPQRQPDDYRCFPVEWPYDERMYVTGWEVEPGEPAIVHHVIAWLAAPSQAGDVDDEDARDEGPGYTCYGDAGVWPELPLIESSIWLGAWAPGDAAVNYPEGTGLLVKPGARVVLQVHYNTLTVDPKVDLTTMHFSVEREVAQPAVMLPWVSPLWFGDGMQIPAGNPDVMHDFAFDPTYILGGRELEVFMPMLHMHQLGSRGSLGIIREGSESVDECLLEIPDWDFDWQLPYRLAEPATLERGDQLYLACHWDNSAANQIEVNGRPLEPRDVEWGDGTTDEMCLGVLYVAPPVE